MRVLAPQRRELIEALIAEATSGGITAGLLEKDEHLTDALRALFALRLEGMQLVFCGGTSLSKAYGLIERMSEDADLKVVLPDAGQVPRAEVRRRLSALKAQVAETLAGIGLVEDKGKELAFNENRYFCSEWSYARHYASAAGLRPHLQIELTARTPVLPPQVRRITTLADQLAGRSDQAFEVPVVAVAETVAEKVLSFLRRYAQHRAGLMRKDGSVPNLGRALVADSTGAMMGAALGTSTTVSYIESAAGIQAGGRTGLTAVTVGALFLLALFLAPLATSIPGFATAPALVFVACLMAKSLQGLDWDDTTEYLPAIITALAMPFTFSIATGIAV